MLRARIPAAASYSGAFAACGTADSRQQSMMMGLEALVDVGAALEGKGEI